MTKQRASAQSCSELSVSQIFASARLDARQRKLASYMTPSGVLMPCTMLSAWAGAHFLGGPRVYDHAARRENELMCTS